MSIGSKIKQMRLIHGWSQGELAKRAFVHHDTIQRIENDKQPAGPKVLRAIAAAFDMTVDDLSTRSPEQAPGNFQERMQRLIDLSLMGTDLNTLPSTERIPAPYEHKAKEIRLQLNIAVDIIKDLLLLADERTKQRAHEFLRKVRS